MRFAYLMQTFLIAGWWLSITTRDAIYQWFAFPGVDKQFFFQFMLPDVIVLCLCSFVVAVKPKPMLKAVIFGGWLYATLMCFSLAYSYGGGWLSCMAMFIGTLFNYFLILDYKMFRPSPTTSALHNGIKTFFQCALVWFLTLVLFPIIILTAVNPAYAWYEIGLVQWIAFGLFLAFSALGITSSYFMVRIGQGTPIPLDHVTKLVVRGPYAYVRNPMAISGLSQGYCVALYFESIYVAAYVTMGVMAWQFVVRPLEETDLLKRFGAPYEEYRKQGKCWWPNFSGFSPPNEQ